MKTPGKRASLKRRFVALLFVVAGAVCFVAGKPDGSSRLSSVAVCGIGLLVAGLVIRLTGKRA